MIRKRKDWRTRRERDEKSADNNFEVRDRARMTLEADEKFKAAMERAGYALRDLGRVE